MSERTEPRPASGHVPDDVDLLGVVLRAVETVGTDSLSVLRPVRGPDGVPDDFVVVADTGFIALLAERPSLGRTLRELMPAPFAERLVALNREALASGASSGEEFVPGVGENGEAVATSPAADPVRVGVVTRVPVGDRVVVLWRDVTQARAAERDLGAARERFERVLEHARDSIVVTTADRVITYASPSLGVILDMDPAAIVGTRFGSRFSDPRDVTIATDLFERVLAAPTGGTVRAEAEVLDGAGRTRRVAYVATNRLDDPVVGGVVINALDVTEQHEAQRRLRTQAMHDSLTGLPNRRWFTHALERALDRSRSTGVPFALLLLDVDDFKVLNDSLGHSAGDRLLIAMSRRIASVLGPTESIARLGGDEFVVLIEGVGGVDGATAAARRVADAASTRYDVDTLATHVTVSVGAVTSDGPDLAVEDGVGLAGHRSAGAGVPGAEAGEWPSPGADALLAHADAALYEAKRRGRNRVEVFDPELRERVLRRVHLGSELHRAIDGDELVVHWQPIVRARDQRAVGLEALVRWQHPGRGLLTAAEFLPVAVDVGLAPSLCTRAADLALAEAARWEGSPDAPELFINLAPVQLSRPALADELTERVERHGVSPARIQVEVAEGVLGSDVCRLGEQLTRLRERGFRIALDDFGAGNTALTWLRSLPIDTLKLDRGFTETLAEPATRTVVRSVLRLAADLGVQTVAEGIETREQLDFYTDAGCDFTQGYLHARPGPADDVWPLLGDGGR